MLPSTLLSALFVSATLATGPRARAQAQVAPFDPGVAPVVLAGSVTRWYLPSAGEEAVMPDTALSLTGLSTGVPTRIYTNLDRVRETVRADWPLAAFATSPATSATLTDAIESMILYAGPYGGPASGIADFYTTGLGPNAPARRAAALAARKQLRQVTPQQPQVPGPAATPQAVAPPVAAQRQAAAAAVRQYVPRAFSIFVTPSRDGGGATVYVTGDAPAEVNPATPVNYTVTARTYTPGTSSPAEVVVDKQRLGGDPQTARFCFAYPVAAPPPGGQINLKVSFWLTDSVAWTHGAALSRTGSAGMSGAIAAIPLTRVELFQRGGRYGLIQSTETGDVVRPAQYLRQVLRRRAQQKQAPPPAKP